MTTGFLLSLQGFGFWCEILCVCREEGRYLTAGDEKAEQNQQIFRETDLGFCYQNTSPMGLVVKEGKYSKLRM